MIFILLERKKCIWNIGCCNFSSQIDRGTWHNCIHPVLEEPDHYYVNDNEVTISGIV